MNIGNYKEGRQAHKSDTAMAQLSRGHVCTPHTSHFVLPHLLSSHTRTCNIY